MRLIGRAGLAVLLLLISAACSSDDAAGPPTAAAPVHVVLFTHIEDNTPGGIPGSAAHRANYLAVRTRLLEMGALARRYQIRWSLQPDWGLLLAALQYEDASLRAPTGGLNFLRYLRDSLGAAIDPHSHEGGGYNYTDVAYLLDSLGVGGSTVIGGHIWDPALPQFQEWDRFRAPVPGQRFPQARWRGDILMGSGTPNHVNDPIVSGVWRPRSRTSYWEDDPMGNIACVGAYKGTSAGIAELQSLRASERIASTCMLTTTIGIRPVDIMAPNGLTMIENTVLVPLDAQRDRGEIVLTDFTALVASWRQMFAGRGCIYRM